MLEFLHIYGFKNYNISHGEIVSFELLSERSDFELTRENDILTIVQDKHKFINTLIKLEFHL